MSLSVASITFAFNSARVLPRQMDALLRQTRPLQEIIVVDNGSTDETVAILAERYPTVTVLRLPSNCGAAGACAAGLAYAALERGHDWVWNFDHDSVPEDSALATMLSSAGELIDDPAVGMLVPLPVHRETRLSYPPLLWRDGFVRPQEELLRQPVWYADMAIASGSMVRKEVVRAIGLPRSDFFMDFFDFEYCLRMRSSHYRIAVINGFRFYHVLGDTRVRRIAGRDHVWAEHPPFREYYMSRNLTYFCLRLFPSRRAKLFAILYLLRHSLAIILFGSSRLACLRKLLQGMHDGRRGTLGIRFLPEKSWTATP